MPEEQGKNDERGKFSSGGLKITKKEKEPIKTYTESEIKELKKQESEKEREALAKRKPKTDKAKKIENFFFHYKAHVIIGIIAVVLAVFFVKDMVFQTKTDILVITAAEKQLSTDITDELVSIANTVVGDLNGDGKIVINFDAVRIPSLPSEEEQEPLTEDSPPISLGDPESEMAGVMKLMAIIASGEEHLFLLDQRAYEYLTTTTDPETGETTSNNEEDQVFVKFEINGETLEKLPFSETVFSDITYAEYMNDFSFYLRVPHKPEKGTVEYDKALETLVKIAK